MQELGDKKIKIIHRNGQDVSGPGAPKKGGKFFNFFSSPRPEARGNHTTTALKEPVLKSAPLEVPRADLAAVKNWAAQEEKIVHEYKEQRTAPFKRAVLLPQIPAKQPSPAFETFSTQTAVFASSGAPKLKRGSGKTSSGLGRFFWVLGCLGAGALVLLYLQAVSSDRGTSQQFAQLQSEKTRLGRSYAALQNASENQSAEMKWLTGQLQEVASKLRTAQAEKVAFEQGLEKKYREELMAITVRYESEIARLRGALQTQDAIVSALKAQGQAFEKIIDQTGMSALSGAAAGLSQGSFSTGGNAGFQGEVTSVNEGQRFVVVSRGADQGIRSGCWITISRSGVELAVGRIDRVYPTTSAAVLRDAGMLQLIQEGDAVSFSS